MSIMLRTLLLDVANPVVGFVLSAAGNLVGPMWINYHRRRTVK